MTDTATQPAIVVGVDGSAASRAALRWARRYAGATGGTVRAVQAWHYPSAFGPAPVGLAPEPVTDETKQRITAELTEEIAKVYPQGSDPAVQPVLSYGHAAEVLINESKDADLLVVGHHGRGSFAAMLMGSVSMHCVTSSACPVVVVREDQ